MSRRAYRQFKRSGTERCPISGYVGPLVEHHIHGRDVRNANAPWNIVWVAPNVHDQIHAGTVVVDGWASTTAGRQLQWHYADGEASGARPPLYSDRQKAAVSPS